MKTKTVTLTLDEDLCRRVRFWAAQRGTSLSAIVRTILETVPDMQRAQRHFPLGSGTVRKPATPLPVTPKAQASQTPTGSQSTSS